MLWEGEDWKYRKRIGDVRSRILSSIKLEGCRKKELEAEEKGFTSFLWAKSIYLLVFCVEWKEGNKWGWRVDRKFGCVPSQNNFFPTKSRKTPDCPLNNAFFPAPFVAVLFCSFNFFLVGLFKFLFACCPSFLGRDETERRYGASEKRER